ncbi:MULTISPECIES: TetR/AcrR family transcriptional regulator [Actinomadura]|uniref:TetR/AcrR family transcriptional regulator n=1 Tax=Actinomadura yumaensis TaxID=111807 RepID=A0ABW2CWR5_9ACTN|nr:TetR/AcrR family transcriptional regulator [Actinomadura sp. J1-007]MWK39172.1 TetR family transcriptional regulator [Actinomadura sp. J1-007]
MPADPRASRRAPAGAAVLREDITEAIRLAVLEELAAHGYGRMSIEAVARRAGVGKTAVYRRWPSKLRLVIDVVSAVAVQDVAIPDTGTLRGDVRDLLGKIARALRDPLATQIVPDLLAEAARNPDIARTLEAALRDTQQSVVTEVLGNAAARGELPAGADADLALDLITGPLYWRLAVARTTLPADYLDDLAAATTAALTAPRTTRDG